MQEPEGGKHFFDWPQPLGAVKHACAHPSRHFMTFADTIHISKSGFMVVWKPLGMDSKPTIDVYEAPSGASGNLGPSNLAPNMYDSDEMWYQAMGLRLARCAG